MVTPLKTGTLRPTKAPNLPITTDTYTKQYQDQLTNALRLYFNQIDNYTFASEIPASGPKTNRPTSNLQLGQSYFDTTLGYPIWYNGTKWVNSSGTIV